MKRKFCILFLLSALSCVSLISHAQEIKWRVSKNWKLYEVRTKASFYYSADTLSRFKNVDLDSVSMHGFLKDVTLWPLDKISTWMGFYSVTTELDGKTHKLVVSNYGGFFYDLTTKRYYEIAKELRDDWHSFLIDNYKTIE